ncbi:amidohydrolase [Burkholderia gladioli]|uniref:amidohydrolase n=1 Tax=Burkholderia gladioli TaxID=28095 RepID=UPI001C226689|nr:amidohydrolase [Burkholderia gladioli]MBU9171890.1 amidohydrolase [Burkholderia gladioli]
MSENAQFGCACCSPHLMLSAAGPEGTWQDDLLEAIKHLPQPQPPESVLFHGGHIYPNPHDIGLCVEAIGIADHRVVITGTLAEVRAAMAARGVPFREQQLDAEQTLLPGLIEPHAHMVPSALMTTWLDLSAFDEQYLNYGYGIASIKEKLKTAIIKAVHDATDPTRPVWVCGYGIDPSLMTVWTDINKTVLDGIVADAIGHDVSGKPPVAVFLLNASGHIGYASLVALELAKLLDSHPDGVLTELQISVVTAIVPQPSLTTLIGGLRKVMEDANARGITTLFDAGLGMTMGPLEVLVMRALATTSWMTVRVGAALFGNGDNLALWLATYRPELSSAPEVLFTLRAIKLVADGSNQGLTGLQSVDYQCCEAHQVPGVGRRGLFNFDPALRLAAVMQQIARFGWPMMTHANGDAAIANVLAAYRLALNVVPPPGESPQPKPIDVPPASRHRIEHASLLTDESIDAMKELDVSPSFLIGHAGYWGKAFSETILGKDRAQMLDRCRSAADAGLRISLHSDHFVTPLGPLRNMEQAIGRWMEGYWKDKTAHPGRSDPVLNKGERLNTDQALRAITIDAAWQCNLDKQVGSLEAGKQADLVILAGNPLTAPIGARLRDIDVLETWVSGRKVFHGPVLRAQGEAGAGCAAA